MQINRSRGQVEWGSDALGHRSEFVTVQTRFLGISRHRIAKKKNISYAEDFENKTLCQRDATPRFYIHTKTDYPIQGEMDNLCTIWKKEIYIQYGKLILHAYNVASR